MSIAKFIEYISFEKRFSKHTVEAYKNDLTQFTEYIKSDHLIGSPAECNHLPIRSWIVKMMEEGISPRTVNRKITTLKTFYKFLLKQEMVRENPMLRIQSPKLSKRLPVFVEKDKMDMLLDKVDFGEGFEAIRDRVIIEMFYATGMRLSELVNLKDSDIDFYGSTVRILGKRNKERLVPFGNSLKHLIEKYKGQKKSVKIPIRDGYFFIKEDGKPLYQKMVYRLVNKYLNKVTTIDKKSPHILRHTFATHMLNNGADLNSIKELLGHTNLSATQIYTHNTVEKLKNVHKQAHPKA